MNGEVLLVSSSAVVTVWVPIGVNVKQPPARAFEYQLCWLRLYRAHGARMRYLTTKASMWLALPATVRNLPAVICFCLRIWNLPLHCIVGGKWLTQTLGHWPAAYFTCSWYSSHFRLQHLLLTESANAFTELNFMSFLSHFLPAVHSRIDVATFIWKRLEFCTETGVLCSLWPMTWRLGVLESLKWDALFYVALGALLLFCSFGKIQVFFF